jgi:hypothetical protein
VNERTINRLVPTIVVGLILVITGLVLGLLESEIDDGLPDGRTRQVVNCGSPWAPRYAEVHSEAFRLAPSDAEQSSRMRTGIGA